MIRVLCKEDSQSPLKICIITPFPPKQDGVAEYSKYLVKSLSKEKLYLYIISQAACNQKCNELASNKKNVHILRIWNPKSLLNQFYVFREVVRIHPDIIHTQYGPYAGYGGILGEPLLLLFLLFKLLNFPCIVTLHSIWLPKEAETRAYERIKNRFFSRIASIYYYLFMKTFLKLFNLILVCVNFSCSNIIQRITETFDIPSLKVREIVHGSIETIAVQKKGETERRLGFEESVLLCIGFIRRDKGYEYAIRALSHLGKNRKKIRMIIAGIPITPDGWNYLAALKDLVKKLHLSNDVIFDTRYIPEEDMTKYFSSSDVILLPYSRRVGPSGPLAMAASFGLPTIMTSDEKFASSNVSAFVKLVPPRNSMALACAIQELLENEETMSKMVGDAVAYASKYSYGEVARQHLSLYFFTMKARGYLRRNS